ncbi:unnamed protein product [Sympodiomycopsis kandeliae]
MLNRSLISYCGLAIYAATVAKAALVEQWWNVGYVQDINPDGLQPRRVIGVNGTWPPPLININSTDQFKIHVTNNLDDGMGTSLHSHGMYFNNTGYYDGAVSFTQCPIPSNQTYTYEILNSPKSPKETQSQWGTFWTHGHFKGQYVDGLRTASIIHPEKEAHQYDEDYTVVLGDWYHDEHSILLDQFMNSKNPGGAEPVPDSALIYFAKSSNIADSSNGYLPGFNDNTNLTFTPGKTYRLRFINMSAQSMFHVWLDGHEMRLIEVDGVDTQEFPTDRVGLAVAQRASVLITAKNTTDVNWKLHANMDPAMFDDVPDTLQLNVTSNIIYNQTSGTEFGPEEFREYDIFDETQLTPFYPSVVPDANVRKDVHVSFDTRADGVNYASFNNVSWVSSSTPALNTMTTMGNLSTNAAVYGPDSNAFVYNHMDMVEVTIYNWDAGNHPFHLHGKQFAVVHKSMDVTSDDPSINPPYDPTKVYDGPIKRDTVMVPSTGSATIRFRADNPGAWVFHCHLDWHFSSGLAMLFVEAPEIINERLTIDPAQQALCHSAGISTTGNAAGLNSTTDFANLQREVPYLESGWNAKAVGSVVGCAITAALGLLTVVLYGSGTTEDDEEEEEEREEQK